MKKYLAEMVGTMVLVLMGCGVAVSLGCDPVNNIPAVVGTAFAFGLSVVAMAYTIGGISGCHINPAITLGCFLSGRISGKDCGMYMLFQVIGAFIGSLLLYILTENVPGLEGTGANDLQANVSVLGGLLAEIIFTCVFVLVVLGATAKTNGATNNFAGLAIGCRLFWFTWFASAIQAHRLTLPVLSLLPSSRAAQLWLIFGFSLLVLLLVVHVLQVSGN